MTEVYNEKSSRNRLQIIWDGFIGAIATVVGLAPHVLHHVGLLVGSALVVGAAGTAIFGIVGLIASIPLLLRLHRRYGTWRAPLVALIVFAVMFAVSAFIVGPAIRSGSVGRSPSPTPTPIDIDHASHHQ